MKVKGWGLTKFSLAGNKVRTVAQVIQATFRNFTPLALFAAGAVGAWYDPSDLSTLFQDFSGAPVTAVGQPVGVILDKSQGLIRGSNVIGNGTFDTALTNWTNTSGAWSWEAGRAKLVGDGTLQEITQGTLTAGTTYEISIDIELVSGSGITIAINGGSTNVASNLGTGRHVYKFHATNATLIIKRSSGNVTAYIDNVVVKPILGNHLIQATAGSRAVLHARVNLFDKSENLADAVYTKRTNNTVNTVGSVNTITNSGNANVNEGVWREYTGLNGAYVLTIKAYAGSLSTARLVLKDRGTDNIVASSNVTLTGDEKTFSLSGTTAGASAGLRAEITTNGVSGTIVVTGIDIRTSADAALNIPAYQRVNTATDYDASESFPKFLLLDGIDDFYSTPATVNYGAGSNDAITVFAGVGKLSDTAIGVVCELGAGVAAGSFVLTAPHSNGAASYGFRCMGDSGDANVAANSTFPAPNVSLVTGLGDISADTRILRANGVQMSSAVQDQGAGTLLNATFFVGRRNGTSLPLNGRLYMLIPVAGLVSAIPLDQTEKWLAAKMRKTI